MVRRTVLDQVSSLCFGLARRELMPVSPNRASIYIVCCIQNVNMTIENRGELCAKRKNGSVL